MTASIKSGDVLQFRIDPQPGETQRACTAIVLASLAPSRRSAIMIGLYAAVIVLAFIMTPGTRPQTVIIGVGAVMATEALLRRESVGRARRVQDQDPHALETHHVELSAAGVRAWCDHVDARYPWAEYRAVIQNPEFFLLLRSGGTGTAIPKRLLDADCTRELEMRLADWVPVVRRPELANARRSIGT